MKLVRYDAGNGPELGALDATGAAIVPLDNVSDTRSMSALLAQGSPGMERIRAAVQDARQQIPLAGVRLLAPVGDPQKILCIGQNYRDHCEEQNQPIPERAILFAKFANAINDPGGVIRLHRATTQVDYEAELAVVIGGAGGGGFAIPEEEAMQHVAGYMCANDVSARDIQLHPAEKQWVRGKTPDGFFPIGPYLVTADEIPDPHALDISLTLNGEVRQKSNTSNLIFKIPYLISHLSQTMTLVPGDIISTGTPGGVGMYSNPQVFLRPGDVVSVTISGLGTLTNSVA
ncbi:MAG: fumarylacetoacetate hydrolase family protein [Chloroherpetonaceae bacterium]|nr:fumarylacetoacetate hydrolase family protein [Chthonomonadaceae bacterium]MDW8208395.1 fumarylacetoacetate hydrolase family protein [Chloroherpetonaceae bacterium]